MALQLTGKNFSLLPRVLLAHFGLATALCLPRTISPSRADSEKHVLALLTLTTFYHIAKTKVFRDIKAVYQGALV